MVIDATRLPKAAASSRRGPGRHGTGDAGAGAVAGADDVDGPVTGYAGTRPLAAGSVPRVGDQDAAVAAGAEDRPPGPLRQFAGAAFGTASSPADMARQAFGRLGLSDTDRNRPIRSRLSARISLSGCAVAQLRQAVAHPRRDHAAIRPR